MKAKRVSYPNFNGAIHPALKRTPNLYVRELQKLAMEQKARVREMNGFVLAELRHFEDCVVEVFCLSFQI